jgi:anti-sigma B factor antagonist
MLEPLQIVPHEPGTGAVVLRLSGSIDAKGSRQLMDACRQHLAARHTLVLNLSGVSFLSSSGVGALLALSEDFAERGVPLRLAELSRNVRLAIDLLNLGGYLDLHEREHDALREAA